MEIGKRVGPGPDFFPMFFQPGRNAFMVCGEIVRVRLPRGSDGLPKGTAFVQYSSEDEVLRPEVVRWYDVSDEFKLEPKYCREIWEMWSILLISPLLEVIQFSLV